MYYIIYALRGGLTPTHMIINILKGKFAMAMRYICDLTLKNMIKYFKFNSR